MLLFSCQNEETQATDLATNATTKRSCASQEVLEAQLKADPTLAIRMNQIEAFTQNSMTNGRLVNGKVEIPVIVNVLYKTAAENISDTQIQTQINVLNQDFNATNPDFSSVPALFSGVAANIGITFVLEKINRNGRIYKRTSRRDSKQSGYRI